MRRINETDRQKNEKEIEMEQSWFSAALVKKLRENAGESLTEVLISVLVAALGVTLFLSAYLASGRMLRQGEEQMKSYYDGRNQLEEGEKTLSGRYVLELQTDETNQAKKSLASDAYASSGALSTGQYSIRVYVNQEASETCGKSLTEPLYRYR